MQIIRVNDLHRNLELKYENIDTLDLVELEVDQEFEFHIKNFNYSIKNKLNNLKLQAVDYNSHVKKPCFNCSHSFHSSIFENGNFNLQKVFKAQNKYDTGKNNYNKKNTDSLTLIESKRSTHTGFKLSIICPNGNLYNVNNLKYYLKNKLDDLKILTFDYNYETQFKKSCFNCSSSFHGSSYQDGHFNLQKIFEAGEKCGTCKRNFVTERSFLHKCVICKASFINCQLLHYHRRIQHNSTKPYQCPVCHLSLSDSDFGNHVLKHKLPYRSKQLIIEKRLDNHLFKHTGAKKLNCGLCDKTFATQHLLSQHKAFHMANIVRMDYSFSCKYCFMRYKSKGDLNNHLYDQHSNCKSFNCGLCIKTFSTLYGLRRHNKVIHHIEQLFQCKYCPQKLKTKRNLDLHLLLHISVNNFKCDWCDKTFPKQIYLNRHKISHVQKPFHCKYCPKKFKLKETFDAHLLYEHKLGVQLKCNWCDKTFNKKYLLDRHKYIHMEHTWT